MLPLRVRAGHVGDERPVRPRITAQKHRQMAGERRPGIEGDERREAMALDELGQAGGIIDPEVRWAIHDGYGLDRTGGNIQHPTPNTQHPMRQRGRYQSCRQDASKHELEARAPFRHGMRRHRLLPANLILLAGGRRAEPGMALLATHRFGVAGGVRLFRHHFLGGGDQQLCTFSLNAVSISPSAAWCRPSPCRGRGSSSRRLRRAAVDAFCRRSFSPLRSGGRSPWRS